MCSSDLAGFETRAATFQRRKFPKRRGGIQHIAIQKHHCRQRPHDILGDMGARRAHKAIYGGAEDVGLDAHPGRIGREGDQLCLARLAKCGDAGNLGLARAGRQPGRMRIVGGDQGDPARQQAFEDSSNRPEHYSRAYIYWTNNGN